MKDGITILIGIAIALGLVIAFTLGIVVVKLLTVW
jgi:hypothetical protein